MEMGRDQLAEEKENEVAARLEEIGGRILSTARNALYLEMRYLDVALGSFRFVMDGGIDTIGTDGLNIYYHPQYLGALFKNDSTMVNRVYLHMVLHGIFRHMIRRNGRERRLYDLSCEIAVESIIDGMQQRCVRRGRSYIRRETYRKLGESMKVLTADRIYEALQKGELSDADMDRLEEAFRVDSHDYWPGDHDSKKQAEIENQWQDISEETEVDLETFSKEAADAAGHLVDQLKVENHKRVDYAEFLRRFAVLREEMSVDADSFDYVFYMYGLSMYGNMPLIEPQETREVKKVHEFAIIIDTSMSCSGDLVENFLKETYGVLSEGNSFFHQVNIHIIQCDEEVHSDVKITDLEDLNDYMQHLKLYGEGGTDFRPAFSYVDELIRNKEFTRLKGVIYFTDGRGIYPEKRPDYDVAFVFMQEDYEDVNVPPWAIKLILREEDLCT